MVVEVRVRARQLLWGASLLEVLPGQGEDPMDQVPKLVGQGALGIGARLCIYSHAKSVEVILRIGALFTLFMKVS